MSRREQAIELFNQVDTIARREDARDYGLPVSGEPHTDILAAIEAALDACVNEERVRIEKEIMYHIGGIAVSHRWFPIDHVLKAIRGT